MFERFTKDAREVVVRSQEEARELGHDHIGTEHVLLAMLGQGTSEAAASLAAFGLGLDDMRQRVAAGAGEQQDPLDPEALASLGIDLEEVRRATEATFGPGALDGAGATRRGRVRGHIPFTRSAKKTLELALRESLRLKNNEIRSGHLLLGLIREGTSPGPLLLMEAGVALPELRDEVLRRMTEAA
jgi:ATP-dependent Clp protease ATP-binding subunit ClpA